MTRGGCPLDLEHLRSRHAVVPHACAAFMMSAGGTWSARSSPDLKNARARPERASAPGFILAGAAFTAAVGADELQSFAPEAANRPSPIGVFGIGQNIGNVNNSSFKQNASCPYR